MLSSLFPYLSLEFRVSIQQFDILHSKIFKILWLKGKKRKHVYHAISRIKSRLTSCYALKTRGTRVAISILSDNIVALGYYSCIYEALACSWFSRLRKLLLLVSPVQVFSQKKPATFDNLQYSVQTMEERKQVSCFCIFFFILRPFWKKKKN